MIAHYKAPPSLERMLSSLRDDPLGSVSMYFAARFDARTAPSASRAAPRKLVRRPPPGAPR